MSRILARQHARRIINKYIPHLPESDKKLIEKDITKAIASAMDDESVPAEKLIGESVGPQRMLFLEGKEQSFKCDCGCNVFTEYAPLRYRCNACVASYTAE